MQWQLFVCFPEVPRLHAKRLRAPCFSVGLHCEGDPSSDGVGAVNCDRLIG